MKTQLFIWSLLSLFALEVNGQKIGGVYFGEIVSEKNALVIREEESGLTGSCYLDKTTKLDFKGTYIDEQLKGIIRLKDGSEVTVEGHLEDGSLKLNCTRYGEAKTTSLARFSLNDRYRISEVFSDNHDPMLVGKWEKIKVLNKDGASISDEKVTLEFEPGGRETIQITKLSSRIAGKIPPGFDPYKKAEATWYTDGPRLSYYINSSSPRTFTFTEIYSVTSDTLVFYSEKFTAFYKRR